MFIPGQVEGGVTEYAKDIATGICYYSYDKFNRMVKASPVGAAAAEYIYNGEGLRVGKIAEGKTTRYMYEYDKVVLEVDGKGKQIARDVQGLNPISRTVDGTAMYYLYNVHADVTALIDGAGNIQGTYYYDAFGNQLETTDTVNNPFTYAGYQYDKETGLYYLNSRMYDPKTTRFMQEDSYIGDFNDPLSLNLYTYCHNEPIMYWDPTGCYDQWDADREYGDFNYDGIIDSTEAAYIVGNNDYNDEDDDGIPDWTDEDSEDYMNPNASGFGWNFENTNALEYDQGSGNTNAIGYNHNTSATFWQPMMGSAGFNMFAANVTQPYEVTFLNHNIPSTAYKNTNVVNATQSTTGNKGSTTTSNTKGTSGVKGSNNSNTNDEYDDQYDDDYDWNATHTGRASDSLSNDRKQARDAWGKRGSKERDDASSGYHGDKRRSGAGGDDNGNFGDMRNGEYTNKGKKKGELWVGVGIVIGGGLIIVGTLAEDVLTGGAGILDDPETISIGIGMIISAFAR